MYRYNSRRGAFWGESEEKEVESEAGMWSIRKKFRRALKLTKRGAKSVHALYSLIRQRTKQQGNASETEIREDKAAELSGKAAEKVEESAEALEAIEGRATGLIAGLRVVEQAIEKYVQRETGEDAKQEKEESYLNGLSEEIRELTNFSSIDERVLIQLQNFLQNVNGYLQAEIAIEEEKEADMQEVISKIKLAVDEMKKVLGEAKAGIGIFKRIEKKVRADYSGALKQLRKAILLKYETLPIPFHFIGSFLSVN